jgi:hypothetical protein
MAKKIKATKTINPLHFEDLEPHRFEDLVRRLLYGFRDWKSIEATGRSGSDEGFDVRAWETADTVNNISDEGEEGVRALDGRLWQIQGKREKTIAPAKMRALIKEGVDQRNPPYGYVLAAATNISKAAYDAFREELRKKGVTEFYFWGKDHLEDQLALPQNDEILFTFFGLSLSPRRRSRTTELKFNINNKNKILKLIFGSAELIGQGVRGRKTFLLRDIKDEHYPYHRQYPDFEKYRRWEEHDAVEVSARDVVFKIRERYAYLDIEKKQWDFSRAVDLTLRKHNLDQSNQARVEDEGRRVEHYWRHLRRRFQAKFEAYGFVPFEDMLIIDDRGDPEYPDPHIFIDFGPNGPFQSGSARLVQNRTAYHERQFERFERVKIFPSTFPEPSKGVVCDVDKLGLSAEAARSIEHLRGSSTLYLFDDKQMNLVEGSLIRFPEKERGSSERHAEVTHIYETTLAAILEPDREYYRSELQRIAGREIANSDKVVVYELHEVLLPFQSNYLRYTGSEFD